MATWFAWNDAEMTSAFDDDFVHTKIVAGCVLGDGRTIVARLPQAEIEARARMMPPYFQRAAGANLTDGLMVVRRNGEQQRLNFVGLDGRTGLSLLEIETPQADVRPVEASTTGERTEAAAAPIASATTSEDARPDEVLANPLDISIGQRVRLLAPERVAPARTPPDRSGVVRLRVNETAAHITHIARTPAGNPARVTLRTERFLPHFAGAIAVNETGALIGIVERGANGEARVLALGEIRRATERVLARRASVPQPWLGARGDAMSLVRLERLIANGWRREQARAVLEAREGVLLTAIAPNAPAALAGLRPGDVILRVGEQPIRGVEDFSTLLREANDNASLQFRVLRAPENAPRDFTVQLSEAFNPQRATDLAMLRGNYASAATTWSARRRAGVPITALGLDAVALPAKIAERFGAAQGGLLVIGVRPNTDAARSGLRTGDLIETINNQRLQNYNLTFNAPPNSPVTLVIMRDGQRMELRVERAALPPASQR